MDEPQDNISISPEIDAEKKLSVSEIVDYLDKHLPEFPSVFKKKTSIRKIEAEIKISQELCLFLNFNRQQNEFSLFHFDREWNYEDSQRSSDIGIVDVKTYHSSSKSTQAFFVIEAKRLPTIGTDKKTKKSREKEYVEGNLGGIQRYKKGHHGNNLSQSAMIGYVQKETCLHWHSKINEWINDLISNNSDISIHWDSEDLLIETNNFNTTKKYTSKNTRIVNSITDSIFLYHYLMELV